jgi:peptidoglycan/LPS O-acetylase OafA/YrhL
MQSGASYRREIDGLRACAVVPVVLFHLGAGWLPGGFLGVDVFFVISGFLITRILLRDIEAGTFSFTEFMVRRILRIVPAMLTMIVATLAASWFFVFRPDQPTIGRQAVAALLSVANVYFWRTTGDYWGPQAEHSPLLHTWSLSVEEQFYLVAPLCFWILHRFAPQRLRPAILAATIGSFGLFLFGLATGRLQSTFYLLPTRAWELGAGCCLAAFLPPDQRIRSERAPWRDTAGLLGLGLIFATFVIAPWAGPSLNWMASLTVVGSSLVLAFAQAGPCHWLLTRQPLTWLGKASFSIYLWHWPVIVLSKMGGRVSSLWLLCLPILLLGGLSYELVEQPSRRNRRLLPVIASGYALAIGLAFAVAQSNRHHDTSAFGRPTLTRAFYSLRGPGGGGDPNAKRYLDMLRNSYELRDRVHAADEYLQGGLIIGPEGTPRVVVLGDSHGCMWAPAIRDVTERRAITTSFQTTGGTQPFIDLPAGRLWPNDSFTTRDKNEFDKARMAWIARWKPDLVIIGAMWCTSTESDAAPLLEFLESHAGHVLLVEQPPELDIVNRRSVMQWLCYQGVRPRDGVRHYLPAGNTEANERGRTALRNLAKRYRNVTVMPTHDLYTGGADGHEALVLDGKNVVYFDDDHLTDYGAQLAAPRFEAVISDLVPAEPITP